MLTDEIIEAAAPRERPYKISDARGLHIFVTPRGAKSWRLKYRLAGRERRLTFGLYPIITLSDARALTLQAKRQLALRLDPRTGLRPNVLPESLERLAELRRAHTGTDRVYFVQAPTGHIKIGVAADVAARIAAHQSSNPLPLRLLGTMPGSYGIELLIHRGFADCAVAREWFEPSQRLLDFIADNVDEALCR